MKNTNPIFSLKNFRSFGDESADFEIAPITVLTGCNSAGKSSLVKIMLLLSRTTQTKYGTINPNSDILNFSSQDLGLGGYNTVIHNNKKGISISYKMWSKDLQEDIIVKKFFLPITKDALNRGELIDFSIEKLDGTIILNSYQDNSDVVKNNFNKFYAIGFYINSLKGLTMLKSEYKFLYKNLINTEKKDRIQKTKARLQEIKEEFHKIKNEIKLKNNIILQSINISKEEAISISKELSQSTFDAIIKTTRDWEMHKNNEIINTQRFSTYMREIEEKVKYPEFLKNIVYINSASAKIARLYSIEEDNKICNALREFNNKTMVRKAYEGFYDAMHMWEAYHKGDFLKKWLKKFEIGDKIEIKGTEEGVGTLVYLYKGENKRLLADEGYGITQLVSLLLQIDNSISWAENRRETMWEKNILDPFIENNQFLHRTICVEEPEIHLHPKYQSLLADMFIDAYKNYNIHFIIETHSEYLIRKLQVMVADKENPLSSNEVSLNYVEKNENGISTNKKIDILEDGSLSDSFGHGFYDEADSLAMDLFRKKSILS